MKKILSLGLACFLFFCGIVLADEGISSATRETLQPDKRKTGIFEEGIGLGPEKLWRVSPGFKYSTIYDSNVNREHSKNANHDVIMNFAPSISISRIGSQFGTLSDYEMNYLQYLQDSDQSGFNHRFNHQTWYESERLKLKMNESFGFVKTYASSEQSERRTVLFNDVNPEAIYHLTSKVSISSIYQNYLFQYKDSALKDFSYDRNDFGGRLYYHATDKTDLFVQGSGIVTDYYKSGLYDSNGFGVYAGAIGQVTDKTILNLKTGFEGREYDNQAINSFYNWVGELGVKYSLTAKTDATLIAKRGIQESVYQNTAWYSFNQVNLGFQYHITSAITAEFGSGFQSNRYPRQTTEGSELRKRADYLVTANSKLKWEPLRHLALALGYVLSSRLSNFDTYDYVDHAVEASASYKI